MAAPQTPMIGNSVDASGRGTAMMPMLSILVPMFGPVNRVACAANWAFRSWSVFVTTENIPSRAAPSIGVLPVYCQVRFSNEGLSATVTRLGLTPSNDEEKVQLVGCW